MSHSQMKKVAVFPASGALGSSVSQHLAKLLPPDQIVLISRNPNKILETLRATGVEIRRADYNAPETFANVFDGVSYLFLISYPSIEIEHRFQAHQSAITAAVGSSPGIEHIFYTSLAFAGDGLPQSAAHVMQAHLLTESWLSSLAAGESKLTFTAIREGIYSETYPMYTAFFDPSDHVDGVLIPHDGSAPGIAWVKTEDLGEANARLVEEFMSNSQNERYINNIIVLSGPRVWTLKETVQLLGKFAATPQSIRQVSLDEHVKNPRVVKALSSHGPGDAARDWTTVFQAIRDGEASVTTGELERLLGRPAEDFEMTVVNVLFKQEPGSINTH